VKSGDKSEEATKANAASSNLAESASSAGATPGMEVGHSILMQQVDEAQKKGEFIKAKSQTAPYNEALRPPADNVHGAPAFGRS
jgi:hypothetical protein